ncbi:hypothetical protein [Streptacidiphilus jiangxiensis]|uniref:Uncharacterized protein n=1 Tax=Streptacidiphilus jiangxiensis TaxID=235985 RepID=A0A1H7H5T2_STRJI|nr:hypothetical protein [Streptacidiphilus jiangxiensis]SEK45644.1 hypothetical protein SAMN05414137_10288 [Streptacidiphilus jiangxiensis]
MIFLALLMPPFLLLVVLALGRWEEFELSDDKPRRRASTAHTHRVRPAHARRDRA